MLTYAIEPLHKKCIEEVQYWTKDGITVTITETWRWGRYFINVDEEADLPMNIDESAEDWHKLVTYVHDYDYELDFTDDGCGTFFEVYHSDKEMTEDEKYEFAEAFEERFYEDYYSGIEEDGWDQGDVEVYIIGPMKIEKIDD